jgi:hypothetical protein
MRLIKLVDGCSAPAPQNPAPSKPSCGSRGFDLRSLFRILMQSNTTQSRHRIGMSVSLQRERSLYIPRVTCPQCGEPMRLARTEPLEFHTHHRMMFDCPRGFEYRMPERARSG